MRANGKVCLSLICLSDISLKKTNFTLSTITQSFVFLILREKFETKLLKWKLQLNIKSLGIFFRFLISASYLQRSVYNITVDAPCVCVLNRVWNKTSAQLLSVRGKLLYSEWWEMQRFGSRAAVREMKVQRLGLLAAWEQKRSCFVGRAGSLEFWGHTKTPVEKQKRAGRQHNIRFIHPKDLFIWNDLFCTTFDLKLYHYVIDYPTLQKMKDVMRNRGETL